MACNIRGRYVVDGAAVAVVVAVGVALDVFAFVVAAAVVVVHLAAGLQRAIIVPRWPLSLTR